MNDSSFDFDRLGPLKWNNTNCTQNIKIWHYLEYERTRDPKHALEYDSSEEIYGYIMQGFKDLVQPYTTEQPPNTQAFWNWVSKWRSTFKYRIWWFSMENCSSQMCKAFGWDGSPDLVGVGMLATYTIQAILVTLYLFAILGVRLDKLPPQVQSSRILSRTLHSVQHSTAEFLSASSVFSLSILIASIISISYYEELRPMTWILALIISLNSVFPVAILHISTSTMLRRSKGRVFMWFIIDILLIGLTVRSSILFAEFSAYDAWIEYETNPCARISLHGIAVFSHIIAGFLCLGITGYIVDFMVSVIRNRPAMMVRLPDIAQWGVVGVCICTMWGFLGWLLNLAIKIQSRAGDNNKDSEWTFGQVLSLATWVPFVVEFAYIWWEDPLQALHGRLMAPYEVVVSSREQSLLEMRPSGGDEARGRFQRLE